MKVFRSNSNEIFSEVINASILKDSNLDDSFVCIILTLSNSSEKSFMPTVQINNDIRDFLCLSPTKGYIKNLSCSHQSIETSNGYYIKFNLKNISDDIKDELIYKLSCSIGLKYRCAWCRYIYHGVIRNIQLHY